MIYTNPLRDVQTAPPTGYCRCGAELYGAETICPDCEKEESRRMSEQLTNTGLIQVVQLPVIEERLRSLKETVEQQTAAAMALVCNADNLAQVRGVRSDLNKTFSELEEQRKAVKKSIMGPYEAFEKVYKECVTEPFKQADEALKNKVTDVEDGIKGKCEAKMRQYFTELCTAERVDWLKFEQVGLKITLDVARQKSHAKLREQIAGFVVGVAQAVNTISKMEDAEEIMAEYRQCLDMGRAIGIVQDRHQRIEEERQAAEARRAAQEAQDASVQKVEAVAPPTALEPPVTAPAPQQENEKVYKCTFTAWGSKAQLKRLKEFMTQEGICYE